MPKTKGDIRIGQRMQEECIRLFPSNAAAAKALKVSRTTIDDWGAGKCPGSFNLAKLACLGGDTTYVLTGIRSQDSFILDSPEGKNE